MESVPSSVFPIEDHARAFRLPIPLSVWVSAQPLRPLSCQYEIAETAGVAPMKEVLFRGLAASAEKPELIVIVPQPPTAIRLPLTARQLGTGIGVAMRLLVTTAPEPVPEIVAVPMPLAVADNV
jgi:hypothetical protein